MAGSVCLSSHFPPFNFFVSFLQILLFQKKRANDNQKIYLCTKCGRICLSVCLPTFQLLITFAFFQILLFEKKRVQMTIRKFIYVSSVVRSVCLSSHIPTFNCFCIPSDYLIPKKSANDNQNKS